MAEKLSLHYSVSGAMDRRPRQAGRQTLPLICSYSPQRRLRRVHPGLPDRPRSGHRDDRGFGGRRQRADEQTPSRDELGHPLSGSPR